MQGKTALAEHWNRLPREDVESPSRDIQSPPGHGPVQLALNEPSLAEEFD